MGFRLPVLGLRCAYPRASSGYLPRIDHSFYVGETPRSLHWTKGVVVRGLAWREQATAPLKLHWISLLSIDSRPLTSINGSRRTRPRIAVRWADDRRDVDESTGDETWPVSVT